MKEQLLQYIWKLKKFDHSDLRLTDGRQLIIQNHGVYNAHEGGPDFSQAQIKIDGISWHGQIEIHVHASDWFLHKHQFDSAYNNVILHVVWENDSVVSVNGEDIPVLQLKNRVLPSVLANYNSLKSQSNQIPCFRLIKSLDYAYLQQMIDSAVIHRLERKKEVFFQNDDQQVLYTLISKTMGGKVNQHSFEYVSDRIPYSFIQYMSGSQRKVTLNAFIEVLNSKTATSSSFPGFKYKGMRPASKPNIRLNQLAQVVPIILELKDFSELEVRELLFAFRKKIVQLDSTISFDMQNSLVINVIAPFLCSKGFLEKALDLLRLLPSEKNSITKKMSEMGFSTNNSYDSQGVIEIYNQFCTQKNCLNCSIGSKIINS